MTYIQNPMKRREVTSVDTLPLLLTLLDSYYEQGNRNVICRLSLLLPLLSLIHRYYHHHYHRQVKKLFNNT